MQKILNSLTMAVVNRRRNETCICS